MKKVVSFLIMLLVVAMMGTVVNATSVSELADTLYEMGEPYGLTSSDKVKIERYIADNELTDAQADKIVAKAEEAVAVMKNAGVTNYDDLSDAKKDELKTIANEAADILGLTLTFKQGKVEIYQDGKLIETVTENNGKLAYTGNNTNMVLVVSSVAVIALVAGFATRKKFANA